MCHTFYITTWPCITPQARLQQTTDCSFSPLCFSGGIKEGDVIVKLNGQPVHSTEDIREVLQRDQPVLFEIRRGNDDLLFNIHPQVIAH